MATKKQKREPEQADLFNLEETETETEKPEISKVKIGISPAAAWPFPTGNKLEPTVDNLKAEEKTTGYFRNVSNTTFMCRSTEHNAPTHLYVPPDKEYVHICPLCRKEQILRSPDHTFSSPTTHTA